jgi:starch synthase
MHIISTSLEFIGAATGGIGIVVSDLASSISTLDDTIGIEVVSPFYDFIDSAEEHVMDIQHQYNNNHVTSEVFVTTAYGYRQLLIKPNDSDYKNIFSLLSSSEIYSHTEKSSLMQRGCYLSSATAAIVGSRCHTSEKIDIVHQHSWATAITKRLVEQHIKTKSLHPKFVTTLHGHLHEVALAPIDLVRGCGIEIPDGWESESFDLSYEAVDNTDKIILVSESLKTSALTSYIPLQGEYIHAQNTNRLTSINNGISINRIDPCSSENLGDLALNPEDLFASKIKIKTFLYENGILSSVDAPLFIYIGRFSPEKGTDVLNDIAQKVSELGGNLIVIGKGDIALIQDLEENKTPTTFISANDDAFQKRFIRFIRAAADFMVIPSHKEAYALTPMESITNGSIIISTGIDGISETTVPLIINVDSTSGNAILYDDAIETRKENVCIAIEKAHAIYTRLSEAQLSRVYMRLMNSSHSFDWSASDGAAQEYISTFELLAVPKVAKTRDCKHTYKI